MAPVVGILSASKPDGCVDCYMSFTKINGMVREFEFLLIPADTSHGFRKQGRQEATTQGFRTAICLAGIDVYGNCCQLGWVA